MTLELARVGATATPAKKSTKIPDPLALIDGKEPRCEDWLVLISQKLSANSENHGHFGEAITLDRLIGQAYCRAGGQTTDSTEPGQTLTKRRRNPARKPHHASL